MGKIRMLPWRAAFDLMPKSADPNSACSPGHISGSIAALAVRWLVALKCYARVVI